MKSAIGDARRLPGERRLECLAGCVAGKGRDEHEARPPRGEPGDCTGEIGGEPGNLARPAAGQHRDDAACIRQAERAPCGRRVRLERKLVGERVPDEDRAQARRVVHAALERQQAQHQVEEARHARRAPAPPGPDLRTHVLHRPQSRRVQRGREPEVELRRVDADEDIRAAFEHRAADSRAQRQQARQVMQDLEQAHHGELLGVGKALAAGGLHARTRDPDEARARRTLPDRGHQRRAQVVARGLAGDEADRQRALRGHQRMMLRSLAARKSTNAASSGCVGTRAFSSAVASASLRPER